MPISRRQFMLGTASGLILPSYYETVLAYFDNHREPLIDVPRRFDTDLFAVNTGYGEYELNLGDPDAEPPEMTVREFAERYFGSEKDYLQHVGEEEEIDLDAQIDWDVLVDYWARTDSPNAEAYFLLEDLDLGPELTGADAVGEIRFIDGACPGNDYLGVEAADGVSVSLLQKRLNELGTGIRVLMG